MGPLGLFSIGDRVKATIRMMGPITPGKRGTVIQVFSGTGRNTLVAWDEPEMGNSSFACSDTEIEHLDVLDTMAEI